MFADTGNHVASVGQNVLDADSDDLAHNSDLMRLGREAFWLSDFWHRRSRVINLESRLEGLVLLLLLLWACGQRRSRCPSAAHVYIATGSGLSAGLMASPQALAVEIDPVGVMEQAVEKRRRRRWGRGSARAIDRREAGW